MTSAKPDITALLGSRICHDLISPLGAIANGVELLAMTGEAASPEVQLISESVENANARIRYFRVAFGAASQTQSMAATEIRSILADIGKASRLAIAWTPDADIPRDQVKLVFLMLLCFETALPWGGQIRVSLQNGRWRLSGEADRMKIRRELWDMLSRGDSSTEIGAAEVQFLLAPILMAEACRTLSLEFSETRLDAQF